MIEQWNHRRLMAVASIATLSLFGERASAQNGVISGKVSNVSSGAPIEGAQVQATGPGTYSAISGADGTYRLVNVGSGSYTLVVRVLGYSTTTLTGVSAGSTTNVSMTPRVVELNETVVTASRSRPEKALDAPAQISVITSERIAERPAVSVADHLRSTPGLNINKGGIAQSNIVARGFNSAASGSMLMLQDYRFASVPSLRINVPFLFTGTNEDIDRIEVLLGPASALYGPNSSSGVLHVITKSPFTSQGGAISVDGGERSVLRTGLRYAAKVNDKVAFKLSGEYMRGKDWTFNDLSEPKTFLSTSNVPASRRGQAASRNFDVSRYTAEARVDIRPRAGLELISTVGRTRLGSALDLTEPLGAIQIKNWDYTSVQQRVTWKRLFAQVFANLNDSGDGSPTSDKDSYFLRTGQKTADQSRVYVLQVQHGIDIGTKQSFTYGVDYIKTDPRTGGVINGANENVDNVTEYGAYIQSSTKPNKYLEVLLAARGDANNFINGSTFSPRAALIFKPTETQNIRLTYNRAFSTPANYNFFADGIQAQNAFGSGFDIRLRGNPPKTGFTFREDCSSSAFGSFCMKSPFAGAGGFVGASAASAFPGLVSGNVALLTGAIAGGLQQSGVPASVAATFAAQAVQALAASTPTNADIATRVSYLSSATEPLLTSQVTKIAPLTASYNQTYEFGYKGIINNRVRYDVSVWGQERGDVPSTIAFATPNVWFGNPAQLGGYIGGRLASSLGPNLAGLGLNPTQVSGAVSAIATALAGNFAQAPLGVVTFDGPNIAANGVYLTVQKLDKKIWVSGLDVALDVVATDRLTLDVAFSHQGQTVWKDIIVGGVPFMSNSPKNHGSLGGRYRDEQRGLTVELRSNYSDAYDVNSGVYATGTAFAIAEGQPGFGTVPLGGTGYGKCATPATGTYCYAGPMQATTFDLQFVKRFDLGAQKFNWTLAATNFTDKKVRTFSGVPEIGRMIMTRLQYTF